MKKKMVWICILAVAIVGVMMIVLHDQHQKIQADAIDLYNQGKFREASILFEGLRDDTAKEWLNKCELALIDQEADAFIENKQYAEAASLLKGKNPSSKILPKALEMYSQELIACGEPEEALALLQNEYPDSSFIGTCEQAIEERSFSILLEENSLDEAEECLAGILKRNADTNRLSNEQIYELEQRLQAKKYIVQGFWKYPEAFDCYFYINDEAGMKEVIALMKDGGSYGALYEVYRKLGDDEGMQSAINALEAEGRYEYLFSLYQDSEDTDGMQSMIEAMGAAGEYRTAIRCALKMGELDWANTMLEQLPEDESTVNSSGFCFESEMVKLLKTGGEAETALASKIVDRALKDCGTLIQNNSCSIAYEVLGKLKELSESLWTEKAQQMMDSCVKDLPHSSRVLKDTSLQQIVDRRHTATITAYNNNPTNGMILSMSWQSDDGSFQGLGESIHVYIMPSSHYTFTIIAGKYSASVSSGRCWFGDGEGFGVDANWIPVKVSNGMYTVQQGERLEGNYSITVK